MGVRREASPTRSAPRRHAGRAALAALLGIAVPLGSLGLLEASAGAVGSVVATVSVSTSPNPPLVGTDATLEATVSAPSGDVTVPSGEVTLTDEASGYTCTVPPTSSSATTGTGVASYQCTEPGAGIAAGPLTVSAAFAGDSYFAAASGSVGPLTVATGSSTLTLSSSLPGGSTAGVPVTYTATVVGTPGSLTPSGSVSFSDDGVWTCSGTLSGTGSTATATCTEPGTALDAATTHAIGATWSGDTNYTGSSANLNQPVTVGPTTTVLQSLPNPSSLGAPVTYTATVTAAGSILDPTGTVSFFDNGATTPVCTEPLGTGSGGVASAVCIEAGGSLTGGAHTITASYEGDSNFAASTAAALSQVVGTATTTTTVTSSGSPSVVGAAVTYTATVADGSSGFTPTGTVSFSDGVTQLCTGVVLSGSGGSAQAQCTEPGSAMTAGAHSIIATYSNTGDPNFTGSTSPAFTQSVNKDSTTVAVMSNPNSPSSGGVAVTYSATVTAGTSATLSPTGTITFSEASSGWSCIATLTAGAGGVSSATCATPQPASDLTIGTHDIVATYSGDANFDASDNSATPFPQVVQAGAVTVHFSANPASPSPLAASVTYTVSVTPANSSTLTPTGTVSLTDSLSAFTCTITLSAGSGTCTQPGTDMGGGDHVLTTAYSGDAYFAQTTTHNVQVVAPNTGNSATTVIQTSGSPSFPGVPVTYTAIVSGNSIFAPTGPVAFQTSPTATFCTAAAPTSSSGNSSTYICVEPGAAMVVGSQTITAQFLGDANYQPTNLPTDTLTQVVVQASSTIKVTNAGSGSAGNPSQVGVPVTYTATVSPGSGALLAPTGTVSFFDGGTPITCASATGFTPSAPFSVTCMEPSGSLILGTHAITAIYSGDSNYLGSDNTSAPYGQVVKQNQATITTVATVPDCGPSNPCAAGQPLHVSAIVTPAGSGNALTPTGTVTFTDSLGRQLCTASVGSHGTATCTGGYSSPNFTVANSGSLTINASYGGDLSFAPAGPASSSQLYFTAVAPNAVLSTDRNARPVGTVATYTLTVSDPGPGLVTPDGTVTFYDGGSAICTAVVVSGASGVASAACATSAANETVGPHVITASFTAGASGNFLDLDTTTIPSIAQNFVPNDTTTTLTTASPTATGSGGPIYNVHQQVTLTAQVSAATWACPATASGPLAPCDPGYPYPDNTTGSFTANGDGYATFLVNGQPIICAGNGGTTVPITMTAGTTPLGTVSCTTSLPEGDDVYTVLYSDTSGNTGYASSASANSFEYKAVLFSTVTTVTASPSSPTSGQPVLLTATVNPSAGWSALPTGTIAFDVNGTPATCDLSQSNPVLNSAIPPQATCYLDAGIPGGTQVVHANYTDPTNPRSYASSTGSLSLTVLRAPTTTTVTVASASEPGSEPVSGQTLAITATVAPNSGYSGTPSGSVVVTTPGVSGALCTITLNASGSGTCFSSAQVPWGTDVPFTGSYAGDPSFLSSSGSTTQSIAQESIIVGQFTASPSPVVYGHPITFSVTLSPQIAATIATGTVSIYYPKAPPDESLPALCTITLTASSGNQGSCTYTPTSLAGAIPAGAAQFAAVYGGDSDFAAGASAQLNVFITPSPATVGISVSPPSPIYGQYPFFALSVTPPVPLTVPSGTVSVTSSETGSTVLCTWTLGTSPAGCTSSVLLPAANNVVFTATYSGDSNFQKVPALTGAATVNVLQATSTTSVSVSPAGTSAYGTPKTFTVTVLPQIAGTPTGTVTITAQGIASPLCTVTLSNGTGSCGTSGTQVPPGSGYTYVAAYSGDTNFLPSNGSSANYTVTTAASTTTLVAPATGTFGSESALQFAPSVAPNIVAINPSPAPPNPSGQVTVKATSGSATYTVCTYTLSSSPAYCAPADSTLPAGTYSVVASYGGDSYYAPSSSASTPLVINQSGSPTTALTISPSSTPYGNEGGTVFAVSVTAPPGNTGTPTGTVVVEQGTTEICMITLLAGRGACSPLAATAYPVGPASFSAVYQGDANFPASTSSTQTLTVLRAASSTSLTTTPVSAIYGSEQSSTLSVTVSPQYAGIPGGTVTLTAGATTLCTLTLAGGTASCTLGATQLPVGSYTVFASYGGDTNFSPSVGVAPLTITQAATATTLSLAKTTVAYGSETTQVFTATVTPTPSGITPTGTVTVTSGTTTLCTITLPATTCALGATQLAPGSYPNVVATYGGNANIAGSASTPALSFTVTQASAPTVALAVTPASVTYGNEGLTGLFSVTVTSPAGTPTGTVSVKNGTTILCTLTLANGAGTCTLGATQLTVGSYASLTAVYSGDANFPTATSSTESLTVAQAATTTTVTATPTASAYGAESGAVFTVTVAPQFTGVPTAAANKVTVDAGTTALCTVTLVNGTGSCSPTSGALLVASTTPYTVTAAYPGDTNFKASTGTVSFRVTTASSTLAIAVSPASAVYGAEAPVTFTATVTPPTSGTPTGPVQILNGAALLCTVTLVAGSGTCTLAATALPVGGYSVTGSYLGDTNFTPALSAPVGLTITQAATATTLSLAKTTVAYGSETTQVFTATVTPTPSGITPTGTVTVTSGTTTLCTITLPATTCALGATQLAPGSYPNVVATYGGNANIAGSASTPALSFTVTQASAPTVALAVTPASVTYGNEGLTGLFSVTVTSPAGTPTGTVSVKNGTTILCTLTLANGAGTCTLGATQLTVGSYASLTAVYSGDANFPTATSSTESLTVAQAATTTTVTATPAAVTFGQINAAVFGVTVAPQFAGVATGTVSVTATNSTTSAQTTLCTFQLGTASSCSAAQSAIPGGAYTVTAAYPGDTNFIASTSAPIDFSVAQAATQTMLTLSSATVIYGNVVTFSSHVSSTAGGSPTGTVTVETTVAGSTVVLCSMVLPATSCTPSSGTMLDASSSPYSVTAVYSGDASYGGSVSPSQNLTVTAAQTTSTVLSLSGGTTIYGNEGTVVFRVGVAPQFSGNPTGAVLVQTTVGSAVVTLCDIELTPASGGIGSCTTTATALDAAAAPYSVTASYAGDNNFGPSVSPSAPLVVNQATSTVALTISPSSATYGNLSSVSFHAVVSPQFVGVPTGDVAVSAGGETLCTVALVGGQGACQPPAGVVLPATGSPYDVTGTYGGDVNFITSATTVGAGLTITKATTSTSVTVAPSSVGYGNEGQAVFTVTVAPQYAGTVPTGTVALTSGTTTLCTVTLVDGSATCSPSGAALDPGGSPYTIIATYPGDANFTGSSGTTQLDVAKATPAISVSSSANPSLPGHLVTFTATVSAPAGLPQPTGTVAFTQGSTTYCAAAAIVGAQATCTASLTIAPSQTITASYPGSTSFLPASSTYAQSVLHGYWTVARDGGVFTFGDAQFYGSMGNQHLNQPVVGMAGTEDAGGYWLVAKDGGIFAFGDAGFYGSTGSLRLNAPIVGMQATPSGHGYWLVASDGGIFAFGDAQFYGSTGGAPIGQNVVGMVATADGHGYWLVGDRGAVFPFGNASSLGTQSVPSNSPVVGLAPTPDGGGYWLSTEDGGVFTYGNAQFRGSMGGKPLNQPMVGIGATSDGGGYWQVASDGGIFTFGNAIYDGSMGGSPLNSPMAALADI